MPLYQSIISLVIHQFIIDLTLTIHQIQFTLKLLALILQPNNYLITTLSKPMNNFNTNQQ